LADQPGEFTDPALQRAYSHAYDQLLAYWPTKPEHSDIRTAYGSTHVLNTGPTDAPPLVLLHGINSTSTFWYPLVGGCRRGTGCAVLRGGAAAVPIRTGHPAA
jgi:pimeloyl-ACP methyl ester carboxylesterase